jgi:hypothetical protein
VSKCALILREATIALAMAVLIYHLKTPANVTILMNVPQIMAGVVNIVETH